MSDDDKQPAVDPVLTTKALDAEEDQPKTRSEKEEQEAFEDFSSADTDTDQKSMQVKVYSPSKVYYAGRAFSITATNATGEFDVLPQHHRFISLLDECQLMVRTTKHGNQKINISGGLMHVRENRVIIFLDI